MEASTYEAGNPSHDDEGDDVYVEQEDLGGDENPPDDDLSARIGKALENFSPFIVRKLNETLEGAMSDHLARKIREEVKSAVKEEFDNRFSKDKETETPNQATPANETQTTTPPKDKYTYKNFSIANPPSYDGSPDPIISTRWISKIEGSFRTTQCPQEMKTIMGASMLRGGAKRWWDDQITVKGEDVMMKLDWSEFRTEFFKEFRSESEVTRLRAEFMNTSQGSLSINEFKVQFMDRAQFCPEYLKNDNLLKEHFYHKTS